MNQLIVTVGIPGSGKTRAAARTGQPVVSPDTIRAHIHGDAANQTGQDQVWAEAFRQLTDRLATGPVILDATSLLPHYRSQLLKLAADTGATPVAWRMDTPLWRCWWRNWRRPRTVPAAAMWRMTRAWRTHCTPAVLAAEGWTLIGDIVNA